MHKGEKNLSVYSHQEILNWFIWQRQMVPIRGQHSYPSCDYTLQLSVECDRPLQSLQKISFLGNKCSRFEMDQLTWRQRFDSVSSMARWEVKEIKTKIPGQGPQRSLTQPNSVFGSRLTMTHPSKNMADIRNTSSSHPLPGSHVEPKALQENVSFTTTVTHTFLLDTFLFFYQAWPGRIMSEGISLAKKVQVSWLRARISVRVRTYSANRRECGGRASHGRNWNRWMCDGSNAAHKPKQVVAVSSPGARCCVHSKRTKEVKGHRPTMAKMRCDISANVTVI